MEIDTTPKTPRFVEDDMKDDAARTAVRTSLFIGEDQTDDRITPKRGIYVDDDDKDEPVEDIYSQGIY